MTIKELKERLNEFPEDYQVVFYREYEGIDFEVDSIKLSPKDNEITINLTDEY